MASVLMTDISYCTSDEAKGPRLQDAETRKAGKTYSLQLGRNLGQEGEMSSVK